MGEGGQWSGRRASRKAPSPQEPQGRGSCRADTEQQREEGAMATGPQAHREGSCRARQAAFTEDP